MATTIGKGVKITGSLTADEPVSIIGILNGEVLVANHAVTVETGGRVDGAGTARVITVQGGSAGRLIARDVVRGLGGGTGKGGGARCDKLAAGGGPHVNGRGRGGGESRSRCQGRSLPPERPSRTDRRPAV